MSYVGLVGGLASTVQLAQALAIQVADYSPIHEGDHDVVEEEKEVEDQLAEQQKNRKKGCVVGGGAGSFPNCQCASSVSSGF